VPERLDWDLWQGISSARPYSDKVRNIAAKEGVNLEEVEGTGTQGRVTKDDITAYLEQRKAAPAAPARKPPVRRKPQ
jgi:2-oxoglutarate dehydrogenase E2 component (dihydrolipoamide succinyltransferase)